MSLLSCTTNVTDANMKTKRVYWTTTDQMTVLSNCPKFKLVPAELCDVLGINEEIEKYRHWEGTE